MASLETAWSDWLWDQISQQYYRYRINAYGLSEYQDQTLNPITFPQINSQQGGYSQPISQHGGYTYPQSGYFQPQGVQQRDPQTPPQPLSSPTTGSTGSGLGSPPVYGLNSSAYGTSPTTTSSGTQNTTAGVPSGGQQSHTQTRGTAPSSTLFSSYAVLPTKRIPTFFVKGRVFATPWPEPTGAGALRAQNPASGQVAPYKGGFDMNDAYTGVDVLNKYNEPVHVEIRRFIVIKPYSHHSLCVPISSHQRKGVVGRFDAKYHSLIYSTPVAPSPLPGEELDKYAIHMIKEEDEPHLHEASRVNYSQTYTVQHNVKVKKVGKISDDLMAWVKKYWKECNDA